MNRIALTALVLTLTAGCTEAGEEGVLRFIGEDGIIDAWADMAAGTKVTVNVFNANTPEGEESDGLVVSAAEVDDTGVASVLGVSDNTVRLEVRSAGTSRLSVTTDVGDDWVEFTSVEPVVVLDEDGTGSVYETLHVVVGGQAPVPYELESSTGEDLLGGGLGGFLLDGEVEGSLEPAASEATVLVTFTAAGEGEVIHPSASAGRSVKAVDPSELASIALNAVRFTGESSEVEGITTTTDDLIMITPAGALADGTEVLGVDTLAEIKSADEAVCTIVKETFLSVEVWMVSLEGAGACEITATLGELTDTVSFTITE